MPYAPLAGGTAPRIERIENVRDWWYSLLRYYDRYPSYAMMLALPSDKAAVQYLKKFGDELCLITGNNCLVITLTSSGFTQYGEADYLIPFTFDTQEHIGKGYCLQVANMFKIKFNEFPCLLLFNDIRKPEHILIALKGLDTNGIAQEMRTIFSVVSEAIQQGKDPITSVDKFNKQQAFSEKKKAAWSGVQSFAGKTFEKMMEAFVEANIK